MCAVQGLKWEFVVVDQPDANAFVVPGGKVVVFTGLERMLSELSFTCLLALAPVRLVDARGRMMLMLQIKQTLLLWWCWGLVAGC